MNRLKVQLYLNLLSQDDDTHVRVMLWLFCPYIYIYIYIYIFKYIYIYFTNRSFHISVEYMVTYRSSFFMLMYICI